MMKMSNAPETFRTKKSVMLDTCFIIHEIKMQKEARLIEFCKNNTVLINTFNLEELKKVSKKLGHEKKRLKHFLENAEYNIIDVPIHLGDFELEREYINTFDDNLLKKIKDPSDGVLVVCAIKSGSNIITRDKHHLFTEQLEEEMQKYGLLVYNDISTYTS